MRIPIFQGRTFRVSSFDLLLAVVLPSSLFSTFKRDIDQKIMEEGESHFLFDPIVRRVLHRLVQSRQPLTVTRVKEEICLDLDKDFADGCFNTLFDAFSLQQDILSGNQLDDSLDERKPDVYDGDIFSDRRNMTIEKWPWQIRIAQLKDIDALGHSIDHATQFLQEMIKFLVLTVEPTDLLSSTATIMKYTAVRQDTQACGKKVEPWERLVEKADRLFPEASHGIGLTDKIARLRTMWENVRAQSDITKTTLDRNHERLLLSEHRYFETGEQSRRDIATGPSSINPNGKETTESFGRDGPARPVVPETPEGELFFGIDSPAVLKISSKDRTPELKAVDGESDDATSSGGSKEGGILSVGSNPIRKRKMAENFSVSEEMDQKRRRKEKPEKKPAATKLSKQKKRITKTGDDKSEEIPALSKQSVQKRRRSEKAATKALKLKLFKDRLQSGKLGPSYKDDNDDPAHPSFWELFRLDAHASLLYDPFLDFHARYNKVAKRSVKQMGNLLKRPFPCLAESHSHRVQGNLGRVRHKPRLRLTERGEAVFRELMTSKYKTVAQIYFRPLAIEEPL